MVAEQVEVEALLRRREVERRTGLPTSSLYREIAEGRFPSPVRIGTRAVAWQSSLVQAWIEDRIAAAAKAAK